MNAPSQEKQPVEPSGSRRTFLKRSGAAVLSGSLAASLPMTRNAHAATNDFIRIGLVGCGGRGSGAAVQALRADPCTSLVAVADAFENRLLAGLNAMRSQEDVGDRVQVDREHRFVGFEAYRRILEADVDVVLLATPKGRWRDMLGRGGGNISIGP